MEYGRYVFFKKGFVRYRQNRLLCNHHLQKMTEVGRTVIITLKAAKDVLPSTHFSPMMLVVKPVEPNCRLCNSHTHGRGLSVNSILIQLLVMLFTNWDIFQTSVISRRNLAYKKIWRGLLPFLEPMLTYGLLTTKLWSMPFIKGLLLPKYNLK